ncbi:MAG: FAD-dependent oxidoreductase [Planctomycetaceae bacterium]|nr:FAD-dependent oxidoreductase [Planctomycetaceae bacterium]
MNIAVIGAGISGLAVARGLAERHEVTVFEAGDYPGGHTNTVDVDFDGEQHAIDTGFIVFNDWTYPRFIELIDELGVASQPTSMSFSVACARTGLEYNGSTLNGLFAQRRNLLRPSFFRMLRDIVRFNREAPRSVEVGDEQTVGDFLQRGGYGEEFANHYLMPMGSAIWSCPLGTFAEFPIRFVVEFYQNHGLLNLRNRPTWRVISGGSRTYVRALLKQFRGTLHLRSPIERVRRCSTHIEVLPRNAASQRFDHVVFACHADQALRMIETPTPLENELLSAFPYERNDAILHTDASVLPRSQRAWAAWNYHLPCDGGQRTSVTYCMSILQHLRSRHVFNVTLNGESRIDSRKVLRQFVYEHPIFTTRRAGAQRRHTELIGPNRSSFCGTYWRNGFHEDGVVSAQAVCDVLNGSCDSTQPATSTFTLSAASSSLRGLST